ncbi:diguanylate cyclase [Agrobacterium rhizogenes]|nr:diguanylate cyclase [Rhizobium rhizogenes]NTJ79482.1 diguanylate cyclase [Rhizobium rhizogenes]
MGRAIKTAVTSANSLVGRYGGEEFAVLLPDTDRSEVIIIAERIRQVSFSWQSRTSSSEHPGKKEKSQAPEIAFGLAPGTEGV